MIAVMRAAGERIGRRDIAIAALLSVLGLALMVINVTDRGTGAAIHVGNLLPIEFAIPLFLLVTLPLVWRRADPLLALGVAGAGLLVNEALLGTELIRCGVFLPTVFLMSFSAGALLDTQRARIGLALAAALTVIETVLELGPATGAVMTGLTVAMWGIGRIVRSRTTLARDLEARTTELRDARDARARLEVAGDRTRLSRELDELLQRRLGELATLAGDTSSVSDPAAAQAKLALIERESRATLEEMRAVVGVLREDGGQAPTTPQPALTGLEALLVRAKGADARLTVEGDPHVLPAAVELSAYRIVEQLLDALGDAPGVEVQVRFGGDALELAVSGPARRGAKVAIERARERARLERGRLDATVQGGRAEAVVSLPVLTAA